MCTRYEDFLVRLKEERVIRKWSQQQMGRKLRMTQSHYCKAELGVRRFTFYEMKCLCEAELDIYYIFTGRRCRPEYQEFYKDCTYEELKCYLAVLCPIAGYLQKKGRLALGADSCRKAESAPYSLASDKGRRQYSITLGGGWTAASKRWRNGWMWMSRSCATWRMVTCIQTASLYGKCRRS